MISSDFRMRCKQFEIWSADLNPQLGTEPGKTRPVIIVQSDLLNKVHPLTIICPLTSNKFAEVNILRINISEEESGLNEESAIMVDQLRAIDNRRLINKIGMVPKGLIPKIRESINIILG